LLLLQMLLFTAHSALSPNLFLARSIYPWDVSSIVVCLLVKGDRQSRKSAAGRVQASLLGVGAPEALVIGVVALLVFGPKGLAEVARTLGKSLRSFQPAIRELQQVSKEFKSTLEQEIGLDELRNPSQPPTTSTPPAPPPFPQSSAPLKEDEPKAYTTEDYLRITEEQANALVSEEQRKAAEAAAWGGQPPLKPTVDIKDPEDAVGEQEGIKDGTSIDKLSNVSQSSGLNS
jgi:TatA/E family protein of Tat protein translocase